MSKPTVRERERSKLKPVPMMPKMKHGRAQGEGRRQGEEGDQEEIPRQGSSEEGIGDIED